MGDPLRQSFDTASSERPAAAITRACADPPTSADSSIGFLLSLMSYDPDQAAALLIHEVTGLASRIETHGCDVPDLVQDSMLTFFRGAWRGLERRAPAAPRRPWLLSLTLKTHWKRHRRERREHARRQSWQQAWRPSAQPIVAALSLVESVAYSNELATIAEQVIERLPRDLQQAMRMQLEAAPGRTVVRALMDLRGISARRAREIRASACRGFVHRFTHREGG